MSKLRALRRFLQRGKRLNLCDSSKDPSLLMLSMAMRTDDIGRDMQGKKIYPVTEYSKSQRIALLINIIHFHNPKSNRHGAEYDTQAMLSLFHFLGYEVVDYQDLTAQEIDEALINFSKHPKLFNTDSVFVVLMSHGGLGTICGSDLKDFETDKIYERLNTKNCPALMNKPKVIIIQACTGGNEGVVKVSGSRQVMATEYIRSSSKTLPKVVWYMQKRTSSVFYSSTRYTFSYRIPKYRSDFIHYICDVIFTYCHKDDIEELFKKMPTKERDTLTKEFYLLPGCTGSEWTFWSRKHLKDNAKDSQTSSEEMDRNKELELSMAMRTDDIGRDMQGKK
ncbi:caspase b-like [Oreochromis aureus]|uniref:caspase b-like n=1 Tax=Oreochromis aureus TaxID=47969 RepID=UPI0019549BD4|nr:caspase b-like [Oreochromis aureus]